MAAFLMLGKYSLDALKGISAERTEKAGELIGNLGGEIVSAYALLGKYDLVLTVNLPGIREAMKASIALAELTGISFATLPAVTVEEFDNTPIFASGKYLSLNSLAISTISSN